MSDKNGNGFLNELTAAIGKNLSNENFGVSELADCMHMSRSNLLRKVKKETNLSVSQLISQVRLQRAMELLRTTTMNVSEVSHEVGFGSSSYFIKCFREFYGYPPGEVGRRMQEEPTESPTPAPAMPPPPDKRNRTTIIVVVIACMVLALGYTAFRYFNGDAADQTERSIAVLPFKNDSADSTNVYLINGIMESTLSNLQKIGNLRVISRTSTEKYRHSKKTIKEMADELNVDYFVEGSGQKIDGQILLNIQLVDAVNDRHLWSKQYRRRSVDIFSLQQEIAKDITNEIHVFITPDEKSRIEKDPTTNLVAYDLFLKALHHLNRGHDTDLLDAVSLLEEAIVHDPQFALAYADGAIAYYYLDIFHRDKKYEEKMRQFADKALLYDPKLSESLVAKAFVYIQQKEYRLALPYLEKALEYNPNSGLIINSLADFHNHYIPNTSRYLEYALMGTRIGFDARDSLTTSRNYLRLADALLQTGFIDESIQYLEKSLAYDPNNYYSNWVKPFANYAKDRDLKKAKASLMVQLEKDSSKLIMLEEIGKVCYLMRDYPEAYRYYTEFLEQREKEQLDVFAHESMKIAHVFQKMGFEDKAAEQLEIYERFAERDRSIYRSLHAAAIYAYKHEFDSAVANLRVFASQDNFQYWVLLMRIDPSLDNVRQHPEFEKIMTSIEEKFWDNHKRLREILEEKALL